MRTAMLFFALGATGIGLVWYASHPASSRRRVRIPVFAVPETEEFQEFSEMCFLPHDLLHPARMH